MLVVTSNWAIGDGSLVRAAAGWHGTLASAVHRAAIRAGFGHDGRYRPIEGVDVVLAGDTFDWLASAAWCDHARPWRGGSAVREVGRGVAAATVRRGRRVLAPLARFRRRGLAVPAADGRGRPGRTAVTVPVRVTLLAGDRDRALADQPRPGRVPFALGAVWSDGRVTIRHGHEADPACHVPDGRRGDGGRSPTLAESVAVDLVARFALACGGLAGATPACGDLVRRLVRCGPVGLPGAIAAWLGEPAAAVEGGAVEATWRRAVERWHAVARREVPSCEVEFDAIECLATWFDAAFAAADETRPLPAVIERLAAGTRAARGSAADEATARVFLGHQGDAPGPEATPFVPPGATVRLPLFDALMPPVFAADSAAGPIRWRMIAGVPRPEAVVTVESAARHWHRGGPVVDAA